MKNTFAWTNPNIEELKELPKKYKEHKNSVYNQIKSLSKTERNYVNTIMAIVMSDSHYDDELKKAHLLSNVHPDSKVREVCSKVEVEIMGMSVELEYDKELYRSVMDYYEGNYKKEKKSLGAEELLIVDDMIKGYKKMGFDLEEKKQTELKNKIKKLQKLSNAFRLNINNADDYILLSDKQISGLEPSYLNTLPKVNGKYKVTLAYPHIGPFMANSTERELREKLMIKNLRKAGNKNLVLLNEMIAIRKEIAKMLGYKNYTDFKVSDYMAANSETVYRFVDDLIDKLKSKTKEDVKLLQKYAKTLNIDKMKFSDLAYVSNKYMKEHYNLDQEYIREFFPTKRVLDHMFKTFEKLFDIKFNIQKTKLWHEDAMHIKVSDIGSGELLSHLLLDLYPRDNKFSHAAAFDTQLEGEKIITLVCNFRAESKDGDNIIPSTLNINEIETLYHEMGHALHFMLSKTKYTAHNGFNVAFDFVETPSQMTENFFFNHDEILALGSHYKTKEKLPIDIVNNIIESDKFLAAYSTMRQLAQTKLDLDIHNKNIKDTHIYYQKIFKQLIGLDYPTESLFPASFGHMDGYDSLYYSYLWALVYACDFYSIFASHGGISRDIGLKYRKEILEAGASRDEKISAKLFLGRNMNNKAFLKKIGV